MKVRDGASAAVMVAVFLSAVAAFAGAQPDSKPDSKPEAKLEPKPAAKVPSTLAKALEVLRVDEGVWTADVSFWLRPGAEPIKSTARVHAAMDLGGHFLSQRFEGAFGPEMGNKPWTSLSYTGFNASTGEYEAVRMATSSATMINVRGKARPDGTIELAGTYEMMGAKGTERDVIRHDGPDKCTIESWMSFDGSPEFKGAEMVLTRVIENAQPKEGDASMNLGNFSVSLSVKDIGASRAFYEKLGFRKVGGNQSQNWLIMQNETSTIGLFQGMIPKNTLTYNPGWDRNCATLPAFDDVREIQKAFKARGIDLTLAADESTTGPASLMLTDPDGNPILIDQHVAAPAK
ncbi:MAG: DUF1579 family protein [Phycisphaeraceae bacterium]|nr:DUF1579 family protein [Phycisphaeraceae bacterium]